MIFIFFGSVLRLFFTSLILFRGYNIGIHISFLNRITQFVTEICVAMRIPSLIVIFYPFLWIANEIANFNISLASVAVTCKGSQLPIYLLLDCIVLGVAVILIQSEMEVYWCTAYAKVHNEFRGVLLQPNFWSRNFWPNLFYMCWSGLLFLLPHPRKILQYALGLCRILVFFEDDGHGASSQNCDATSGGIIGVDTMLALLTSAVAYSVMLHIFTNFSALISHCGFQHCEITRKSAASCGCISKEKLEMWEM